MSQSGWYIYVYQNIIVNVSNRLKPLFLDPYCQFCKYSHASKLFCLSIVTMSSLACMFKECLKEQTNKCYVYGCNFYIPLDHSKVVLIYLVHQALKYLKIGTCPASQKLLVYMEKMLIYIGNDPTFHLPCSLRHS